MIDLDDLRSLLDQEVGVSDWIDVTQDKIDRFADVTGDRQWIHTDPDRAATASPFGTTIAHGFLTLSLVSAMLRSAVTFSNVRLAVNYGLNRVRFVAPVLSGSRVRGRVTPTSVEDKDDAVQVTWSVVIEREHGDRPCAVVEWIVRYQYA